MQESKRRFSGCRDGFTLMELLVVIGIMSILTVLSIGGYMGSSQAIARKRGAMQLASVLSQARQRACMSNTRTAVIFSEKNGVRSVYTVCSELGSVIKADSGYYDIFGGVFEKIKGSVAAGDTFTGEARKSYSVSLVNIETGQIYISDCGANRTSFQIGGELEYGYLFRDVQAPQSSGANVRDVVLWMAVSQNYYVPGGYEIQRSEPVVFNGDGSGAQSSATIGVKFLGGKSTLDFTASIDENGRVK